MNDTVLSPRTAPGAIARAPSPLSATRLRVDIDDLLATLTLEQDYENREAQAIEASYTLALPQGGCLLDVHVRVGEHEFRGRVEPAQQAEARYEQALAEGHSAYAIRLVDDHLLNLALGNLLPGERLTLSVRIGLWLAWNGERVRLTLPTTLAPRYGQCQLQPPDQPLVDLLVENGFRLDGRVRGLLAGAELASPTHRLGVRAAADGLDFSIERGLLDRDIVIDLRDRRECARISACADGDLDGRQAVRLSFCADAAGLAARPLVAEIVVDCSGSMGGVSIEQTRAAVRAIVARLQADDRINILRFGSTHQWLLRRPQPVTPAVQRTLLQGADELQANLGGTELLGALDAGLEDLARLPADTGGERVLFVISDGEVWNLDSADFLRRCAQARVRVYAVAVGTAAVEATFAPLVKATGGALERVLPGDEMAARIERHFQRMRFGALRELAVEWPQPVAWQQGPSEVHPGDGVVLAAGLERAPESVAVRWRTPDGRWQRAEVPVRREAASEAPSTSARLLARERLAAVGDAAEATKVALAYQLVTPHTSIAIVNLRGEAARQQQLPQTRQVPQMLAAGWAGSASAGFGAGLDLATFSAPADVAPAPALMLGQPRALSAAPPPAPKGAPPQGVLQRLVARVRGRPAGETRDEGARGADPDAAMRAELVALLVARLAAEPALARRLAAGELGLDALGLTLSTALFNWLDARAEAESGGLEDAGFWRRLLAELCATPQGAALRALLRT